MSVSIQRRLASAFALLIALPVAILILNVRFASQQGGDGIMIDYAGSERMRAFMTAGLSAQHLRKADATVRSRIEGELMMWERVRAGLLNGDSELGLKGTDDASLRTELERAGTIYQHFANLVRVALDAGGLSSAERDVLANDVLVNAFSLYGSLDTVTRGLQQKSDSAVQSFLRTQAILATAVLFIAFAAMWGGYRFVLRSMPRFLDAMRAIGRGELRTRVPEDGPAELAAAARAFNSMGTELERAQSNLLEHERTLAHKNQELEHANRLKSEFLANMSHELRTPLNAVLGYAALLRRGLYGPLNSEQLEALEGIRETGSHLLEVINDVLDLSKFEAGKMDAHFAMVDMAALIQDLARSVEPLVKNKGLEFRRPAHSHPVAILTDAEKARRVLLNFLSNAIKYTRAGCVEIVLNPSFSDTEVAVEVRDTGEGILATDIPHIFEDFRQGDGSPSREFGGTGLGLSICRRLARLLGARIEVDSAIGAGSTFALVLPRAPVAGRGGEVRIREQSHT